MEKSNPINLVSLVGCRIVLLLTLGTIKNLDIKLWSTTMIVKQQETTLVQIVIFTKAWPSSFEENITLPIIIYFQFM
jgi:hypothetical protein